MTEVVGDLAALGALGSADGVRVLSDKMMTMYVYTCTAKIV